MTSVRHHLFFLLSLIHGVPHGFHHGGSRFWDYILPILQEQAEVSSAQGLLFLLLLLHYGLKDCCHHCG